MPLVLRYMRLSDVPEVVTIDQQSFSSPWPSHSYQFEVSESTHSFMAVLQQVPYLEAADGAGRLRQLIRSFSGSWEREARIQGYGGLWVIMEEAHISTIASHPEARGKGYGEAILAAMIQQARRLHAGYVVLEVRVSNAVAQALYHKYEFETVGIKHNYYRDDNEDAYDMRLDLQNAAIMRRFEGRWAALKERVPFVDYYSGTPHPRFKR